MRLLLTFFLLSIFETCFASGPEDFSGLDKYFFNLKAMRYQLAKDEVADLNDSLFRSELILLSKLLYYGIEGDSIALKPLNRLETDNDFINAVNHLNHGYYEILINPDKSKAYQYFYEALSLAESLAYNPLKKQTLIAMLDYFSSEIGRTDADYQDYFNQFQKLKNDDFDEILTTLYELKFLSNHVNGLEMGYFEKAKELDIIENELKEEDPILGRLFFEKAMSYDILARYGPTTDKSTNLAKAKLYFDKSLLKSHGLPFYTSLRFSIILKLADIANENGNPELALDKLDEIGCCLNKNDTLKDQFYIHYYRAKFLKKQGQFELAYHYLDKRMTTGYLMDYRNNSVEISKLEVQLDTEKKEKQILQQQTQLETEQRQKRNLAYGAVISLLIGSLLAFLIHNNTKRKQLIAEQEKALQEQKVATLLKEQELTTIDAMIEGQEKERQRIANDLHDDLGGLMATVKLHFNSLQEKNKDGDELYGKTNSLLDEAYNKIRAIAHAKNSGVIAKQGLLKAVHQMAEKVSTANRININVIDHGLENRLENSLELTLFRIIQELITNTIKHAQATEVNIHLTNHEDALNIMVEDNGIGFTVGRITSHENGMGLKSIDKRIAHLNGSMDIESEPGKGTTIIIDIPI